MRTPVFFTCLIFFALASCSSKYGIQKSYAFSRTMTAGNIPVDENNRPRTSGVQKTHLIYIETGADTTTPKWDTVWVEGKAYTTTVVRITQDKIELGKTKNDEKQISIQPVAGNFLWQIMLNPLHEQQPNNEQSKNPVTLTGVWKNKRVSYGIKEQTELAPVFGE